MPGARPEFQLDLSKLCGTHIDFSLDWPVLAWTDDILHGCSNHLNKNLIDLTTAVHVTVKGKRSAQHETEARPMRTTTATHRQKDELEPAREP